MLIKKFTVKGNTYEVRKILNGDDIRIQIFDQKTGMPVSATYDINFEEAHDAILYGYEPVKELAEIAQNDFLRWDTDLKYAFSGGQIFS